MCTTIHTLCIMRSWCRIEPVLLLFWLLHRRLAASTAVNWLLILFPTGWAGPPAPPPHSWWPHFPQGPRTPSPPCRLQLLFSVHRTSLGFLFYSNYSIIALQPELFCKQPPGLTSQINLPPSLTSPIFSYLLSNLLICGSCEFVVVVSPDFSCLFLLLTFCLVI